MSPSRRSSKAPRRIQSVPLAPHASDSFDRPEDGLTGPRAGASAGRLQRLILHNIDRLVCPVEDHGVDDPGVDQAIILSEPPCPPEVDGEKSDPRPLFTATSSSSSTTYQTSSSPAGSEVDKNELRPRSFLQRRESRVFDSTEQISKKDWRALEVDVWTETVPDLRQFCFTLIYELIPPTLAWPLCCCLESRTSAFNRLKISDKHWGFFVLSELLMGPTVFYVMLILYLFFSDDKSVSEVHWVDVALVGMLKLHRAMCLASKYAYFSRSEILCVQGSEAYGSLGKSGRQLGVSAYYDDFGSLEWDHLEKLCGPEKYNIKHGNGTRRVGVCQRVGIMMRFQRAAIRSCSNEYELGRSKILVFGHSKGKRVGT